VVEAPKSDMRDVLLLWPFQAPADTIKDTTEELCSVIAQYAISTKASHLYIAPSSREASPGVVI
jgi:hypothetical protein